MSSSLIPGLAARRLGASLALILLLTAIGVAESQPARAATLPSGFVEKKIAAAPEFWSPYAMDISPDGRVWVLEQTSGKVRIVKNDVMLTKPFVKVPVQTGTDRGLISMVLHPSFPTTPYVYLQYTTTDGTNVFNRVSRFTANGDVAVAGSERVVWDGEPLNDALYHYGGGMWFGADGKLYLSLGDRLRGANAQELTTTWGKILRINPDGTIPSDNPFSTQTTGRYRAIWALGLRNPWQSAQQKSTGRVFISDVGAATWEELNEATRGANYGWNTYEGSTNGKPGYTDPIWQYHHSIGSPTGCAITGGDFYDPAVAQLPSEFVGTFIVADHCQGWVKSVDFRNGNIVRDLFSGLENPVDVRVGSQGQIYYLVKTVNGQSGGGLFRVDYVGTSTPLTITQQPSNQTVPTGGSATFSVMVSGGTGTPRFQWQRNGVDIAGATASTYTLSGVTSADNGAQFRVVVSDDITSVTSTSATLTVTANQAPTATIDLPVAGATYAGGDTIQYSGSATDPEDGPLPPSAFTWEVVFHHNTHTHDFITPISGSTSGSFSVPRDNETATDVFYRVHLTVKDSAGATAHVYRDVQPRLSTLTIDTSPPGLLVTLDGLQKATPLTVTGVEGITRTLGVVQPQQVGGTTYVFESWSDGGAATHNIATPVDDTTYKATFKPSTGKSALLVVGSAATPGNDNLVKSRLEAMGYVTRLVDDDVATSADADGMSLVVISSSVNATTVGTKFRLVAVPVLSYKPYSYDDMLMTGPTAETDYGNIVGVRTVSIVASAHPLAAGGARTVTLTSVNATLPWGLPPSTADVVGTTSGKASLFTFSPGDQLYDGRPAPACRVAFPSSLAAFGNFTQEGWSLFDQTVDWIAAGCTGA